MFHPLPSTTEMAKNIPHRYQFCEIPNDDDGREFVRLLRKYANRKRYNVSVKGQYLDKTKLDSDEDWRDYTRGQPINKSTHIRVYLHDKFRSRPHFPAVL